MYLSNRYISLNDTTIYRNIMEVYTTNKMKNEIYHTVGTVPKPNKTL